MDFDKLDTVSTKFDGKNFALWEFHFRNFVAGKRLLSVLTGNSQQPNDSAAAKDKEDWVASNAQLVTWLLSSMDVSTALSLRRFSTAAEMWKHICKTHSQTSTSRQYELEIEISQLAQGDRDIRTYYQDCMHLWIEYDLLTASLLKGDVSEGILKERTRTRVLQFLMKLRSEYEPIRASLIHRDVAEIEEVVAELLREETRLKNQAQIDNPHTQSASAFAAGRTQSSARPQFTRPATGEVHCFSCREAGHVQIHCKKRNFCHYCKKPGHIVLECPILVKRGKVRYPTAGTSSTAGSAYAIAPATASTFSTAASSSPVGSSMLSPEFIRRLVQEALQDTFPQALTSALATGATPGPEDGESDRERR